MHLPPLIQDLALILGVAALTTYVFRKIRQPVVLGYLVAGMIVGPHSFSWPSVSDMPNLRIWGELGVIFVMFSLGLDFSFRKLVRIGSTAASTAVIEVSVMLALGYFCGKLLGWGLRDCLFLGGMLCISSTTVIYKTFDELGLRSRYFADQVFGILIVEDLVAILLMVALTVLSYSNTLWDFSLILAAIRLTVIVGGWFLVGYFIVPTFLHRVGHLLDSETMTILVTGLCLSMVALATSLGYSAALGAFIMGSLLAETQHSERIIELVRPLRDLFAAVFFISVGMLVDPVLISENGKLIAFVTLILISGKIVAVTLGSLATGQKLKPSIQTGFSLAQIGEFSFIIASLGATLGVTNALLYPIAVAVSAITTFTTPYLVRWANPFADWLENHLPTRIQSGLERYSTWMQSSQASHRKKDFTTNLFRFLLNGILVTIVFILLSSVDIAKGLSFVPPFFHRPLFSWGLAVSLSAPFVWGMFFSFKRREKNQTATVVATVHSLLAQVTTLVWVGVLSATFFDTLLGFLGTLVGALAVFLFFYRSLRHAYFWLENRLIGNLKEEPKESEEYSSLAPWDLHLSRITLHPDSPLTGKTIKEASIRQAFGLNVVAIQRGSRLIAPPSSSTPLYPSDLLLVLGSDGETEAFRNAAEGKTLGGVRTTLSDYALTKVHIDSASPYLGKSIRDSQLQESKGSLVVGLETGGKRIANPNPDQKIETGQILWIISPSNATPLLG
jgi:monovalent cation:H+ antiporter-2, CPA2 family